MKKKELKARVKALNIEVGELDNRLFDLQDRMVEHFRLGGDQLRAQDQRIEELDARVNNLVAGVDLKLDAIMERLCLVVVDGNVFDEAMGSQGVERCACGLPETTGVHHRTDGPCYHYETQSDVKCPGYDVSHMHVWEVTKLRDDGDEVLYSSTLFNVLEPKDSPMMESGMVCTEKCLHFAGVKLPVARYEFGGAVPAGILIDELADMDD